ncbi:MAG: hypothetical protein U0794_21615 [Isosphaeraceae bacterium]
MADLTEFQLPDDLEGNAATEIPEPTGKTGPPSPLIVVEYRSQGLLTRLTPPLLILVVAVAVTISQRRAPEVVVATARPPEATPDTPSKPALEKRPGPQPNKANEASDVTPAVEVAASSVAEPPRGEPDPSSSPQPDLATLSTPETTALPVLPIEPAPVDSPATDANPGSPVVAIEPHPDNVPPPPASPFELDSGDGLKPVPPGETLAANAVPATRPMPMASPLAPLVPPDDGPATLEAPAALPLADRASDVMQAQEQEADKNAILDDIQREAAAIQNQRKDLEELKPRAQAMLAAEAITRIQADRTSFRDELRETLKVVGPDLGQRIDLVISRHGREAPPQVMAAYYRALRMAPKRMTRQGEIDLMRLAGLPEPMIFDFLANKLHRTLNTRGGPRDENEVRVRAARLLLSYPLAPNPGNGPARDKAPVARVSDRAELAPSASP